MEHFNTEVTVATEAIVKFTTVRKPSTLIASVTAVTSVLKSLPQS